MIESCQFGPYNGIDFKSRCFHGFYSKQQCKFIVQCWKRIRILCKHRLKLYDYPILKCIYHQVKNIDMYYGHKNTALYLNKDDCNAVIYFITMKTNKKKNKQRERNDKSYKIDISMLTFIWKLRSFGYSIVTIMDMINSSYSSTMQTIHKTLFCKETNVIDLEQEFIGYAPKGNKYTSGSLINRVTMDLLLTKLQRGYARGKWEQFQGYYHQRPVEEFAFDATFAICSKLFYIKNKKWHLLKVSFGHLEDDIGLTPDGLILINAAESHEKLVEFFANFMVLNIWNCRTEHPSYMFKIGTDNSGRDVNIGDKIIAALKQKLNLDEVYNPVHINDHGVQFDIRRLEIIVKFSSHYFVSIYINIYNDCIINPLFNSSSYTLYLFVYICFFYKNVTYLYVIQIKRNLNIYNLKYISVINIYRLDRNHNILLFVINMPDHFQLLMLIILILNHVYNL